MTKENLDEEIIITTVASLANEVGLEELSLKMVADALEIKSPSLYNYFTNLENIKERLMLYGWRQVEDLMINAATGVSGYDALRAMCYAFYDYTTTNPGVFTAMLWYNKYDSVEYNIVTKRLFRTLFKIMRSLNLDDEIIHHTIRTFRSFLEGYVLLVNNRAFGSPLQVRRSFDISLEIILRGINTLESDIKYE